MKTVNETQPQEKQAIAYYRVSTQKQGISGLGLEAQQASVLQFIKTRGYILKGEFTEIESGKKNDRPRLLSALEYCRKNNATLIIAKLDRLSRNASFTLSLKDSGVQFVAVDNPDINGLTIGILALVAQDERERICARTKAALEAKKARGFTLGKPENMSHEAQLKGAKTNQLAAIKNYKLVHGYINTLKENGLSINKIAIRLNLEGFTTVKGSQFTAMTVKRIIDRVATN